MSGEERDPVDQKSNRSFQGPLDGTEPDKVSTLETHWWMIEQKDVELCIQLCRFVENGELRLMSGKHHCHFREGQVRQVLSGRSGKYHANRNVLSDVSEEADT